MCEWEEEKITIKYLIKVQKNCLKALDFINKILPKIYESVDNEEDMIYYCLFNKSLCLYKLNKINDSIDTLKDAHKYAITHHDFMKIDWTNGLCYEHIDKNIAIEYYDKAIHNCLDRKTKDIISACQIKCTKATLINDINLMENSVNEIISENPTQDIIDTAYNSLCRIYIKNELEIKAYGLLKKIKNEDIKKVLKSKILI